MLHYLENVFTGDFTVTAPDITPNGGTYNGATTFNKTEEQVITTVEI